MDFNNNTLEEEEHDELFIRASDIILVPYNPDGENLSIKAGNEQNQIYDESLAKKKKGNIDHFNSLALTAYLSTPKFVKKLTDISLELIHV